MRLDITQAVAWWRPFSLIFQRFEGMFELHRSKKCGIKIQRQLGITFLWVVAYLWLYCVLKRFKIIAISLYDKLGFPTSSSVPLSLITRKIFHREYWNVSEYLPYKQFSISQVWLAHSILLFLAHEIVFFCGSTFLINSVKGKYQIDVESPVRDLQDIIVSVKLFQLWKFMLWMYGYYWKKLNMYFWVPSKVDTVIIFLSIKVTVFGQLHL